MKIIYDWKNELTQGWRIALADSNFAREFCLNLGGCLFVYFAIVEFLKGNRFREGAILKDPIQLLLQPHDFSALIFVGTYLAVILFLLHIVAYPRIMHLAFRSFTAVFLVRAACIYLVPLHPAIGFIPLNDPFTEFIAHENFIYNDLFFSGHMSDLTIFALAAQSKRLRYLIVTCAFFVGLWLVWQRVHYSIDVIAAPFFAYVCHVQFLQKPLEKQRRLNLNLAS